MLQHYLTENGILYLTLTIPTLDIQRAANLRKEMTELINTSASEKMIIDLSLIHSMDSAGLVCLLSAWREAGKKKMKVVFICPHAAVRHTIELVSLHHLFHLSRDKEEALAKLA